MDEDQDEYFGYPLHDAHTCNLVLSDRSADGRAHLRENHYDILDCGDVFLSVAGIHLKKNILVYMKCHV